MVERIGVFPGCFDPLAERHIEAIRRARGLVDRLVVGVAETRYGQTVSPSAGRAESLRQKLNEAGYSDIEVEAFADLVATFAERRHACVMIRRAETRDDFQRVRQEAALNSAMFPQIETLILGPPGRA
jgi:pantetheine-phosphate adenylyltransferase